MNSVFERGLAVKDDTSPDLINSVPKENLDDLKAFASDCLQKAGLIELSEKLSALNGEK